MPDPHLTVNGRPHPLAGVPAHTNALDFLRGVGLTGAKEGCAEGECGACAVMVARPDVEGGRDGTRWTPVNACLVPAAALDGQEVVTAEGLGSPADLHPVQAELAERGGSQCGYCTPGFVCSMAAEYYRPDRDDFDLHAIGGDGRPAKVELATLIDRGHREMPIQPDYTGILLETSRHDHVHVSLEASDGEDKIEVVARTPD